MPACTRTSPLDAVDVEHARACGRARRSTPSLQRDVAEGVPGADHAHAQAALLAARAIAAESSSIERGRSTRAGVQRWSPAQLRHRAARSCGSLGSLIR